MGQSTVSIETIGETVVSYATAGELRDEDLDRLMAACTAPGVTKYLSISNGVISVNATQRATARKLVVVDVVAIIDNKFLRGVATVLSWFGVKIQVFPPERQLDAVMALGLEQHETTQVRLAIERLKRQTSLTNVA